MIYYKLYLETFTFNLLTPVIKRTESTTQCNSYGIILTQNPLGMRRLKIPIDRNKKIKKNLTAFF